MNLIHWVKSNMTLMYKTSKIRASKNCRLTELSSSFSWARLSSKSCSRVSVRPLTGGGAGCTTVKGEHNGGGWGGEEMKDTEGRCTTGRAVGVETPGLSETARKIHERPYTWHHVRTVMSQKGLTAGDAVTDWLKEQLKLQLDFTPTSLNYLLSSAHVM